MFADYYHHLIGDAPNDPSNQRARPLPPGPDPPENPRSARSPGASIAA